MPYSSETELAEIGDARQGAGSSDEETEVGGAVTGFSFTPSQVAYMKEKLDSYSNTPPKKRRQFLKRVCNHFKSEINKEDEKPMDRNQETLLFEGIRTWFKSSLKPIRKSKNQYGMTWYPRLVYIKTNTKRVKALANRYVKGDFDVGKFLEEYDSEEPDFDIDMSDGEEGTGDLGKRKGKKGKKGKKGEPGDWFFNHYQDAATDLMAQLPQQELDRYEKLAAKWNAQGPPKETQAKNADKMASKRALAFAKDMNREFNAITMTFVGWRRENGRPVAILSEFSKSFGRSVDFSIREKSAVTELFRSFRNYVYEEFEEEDASDDDTGPMAATRGQKQDLMPMIRNSFGEPFLPDIATRKSGTTCCDWLRIVLRSFFIYHYQNSGNFKSPHDFRFPWTAILANPREFISEEMMDDDILKLLKEPSDMRVGPMLAVYNFLYDRQKEARTNDDAVDDLTFELKSYIDQDDEVVPRHPRVISMEGDGWGEYDLLEDDKDNKVSQPHTRASKPQRSSTVKTNGSVNATQPREYAKRPRVKEEYFSTSSEEEDEGSLADSESETDLKREKRVKRGHSNREDPEEASLEDSESESDDQPVESQNHYSPADYGMMESGGGDDDSLRSREDADGDESAGWSSWSDSEAEADLMPQVERDVEATKWDKGGSEDEAEESEEDSNEAKQGERDRDEGAAEEERDVSEEDIDEAEQPVSSFRGIRTRNQKARAKAGLDPPKSASQVGLVTRSKDKRPKPSRVADKARQVSPPKAAPQARPATKTNAKSAGSKRRADDRATVPERAAKRTRTAQEEVAGQIHQRNRRGGGTVPSQPSTPLRTRPQTRATSRTPQTRAASRTPQTRSKVRQTQGGNRHR